MTWAPAAAQPRQRLDDLARHGAILPPHHPFVGQVDVGRPGLDDEVVHPFTALQPPRSVPLRLREGGQEGLQSIAVHSQQHHILALEVADMLDANRIHQASIVGARPTKPTAADGQAADENHQPTM